MKNVILYSTFVPDVSKLNIAIDILNEILAFFPNDKIIIGNSWKSISLWNKVVEAYQDKGYNIVFSQSTEKYLIDSDAQGYQRCLYELKNLEVFDYDLVWFFHTKGITNDKRSGIRNTLMQEIIKEKFAIESHFSFYNELGSYGYFITKDPIESRVDNNLKSIDIDGENAEGLFYPHTWYVIQGKIISKFLHQVKLSFYRCNLLEIGFDRYFFERDFPGIVQKMGYKMGYKQWKQHQYTGTSEEALQNCILL